MRARRAHPTGEDSNLFLFLMLRDAANVGAETAATRGPDCSPSHSGTQPPPYEHGGIP